MFSETFIITYKYSVNDLMQTQGLNSRAFVTLHTMSNFMLKVCFVDANTFLTYFFQVFFKSDFHLSYYSVQSQKLQFNKVYSFRNLQFELEQVYFAYLQVDCVPSI